MFDWSLLLAAFALGNRSFGVVSFTNPGASW
jgi:hypothetical protein